MVVRRVGILSTIGVATALLAFASWCVVVLSSVTELRAGLEQRVGWLSRLHGISSGLRAETDAGAAAELDRELFAVGREMLQSRETGDALANSIARASLELRGSLDHDTVDGRRRSDALQLVDASVKELRAENAAVSAKLGAQWDALCAIAWSAIGIAGVTTMLFGYLAIVSLPRARADSERMRQMARRMDEMQATGRLVGHELGGPLTVVMTNLQLLRARANGPGDDEGQRLIDDALRALARATGTLQDLRASSDSSPMRAEADVQLALDDALAAVARRDGASRVQIERANVPIVRVPEPVVRRLFTDVLDAALERDGVSRDRSIRVSARDAGAFVAIEFGLPAACAPALSVPTMGRAVESIGGRFSFETRGVDAVARFELPVDGPLPAVRPIAPPVASTPGPTPAAVPAALRILLVDDDELVVASVRRVLKKHVVDAELDGRRAITRLCEGDYDLVLCDVMMPGTSGIEVFEQVARRRPEIAARFVFMSGGAVDHRVERFLAEQAPARIDKPFGSEALRSFVEMRVAALRA